MGQTTEKSNHEAASTNMVSSNTANMASASEPDATSFLRETTKKRPLNTRKLARRTLITILMAVLFGGIASITFLGLQPFISRIISPEEEVQPNEVRFPEDTEEKSPEQMLADYMQQEAQLAQNAETEMNPEPVDLPLTEDQVAQILSQMVLDKEDYRQLYTSMTAFSREMSHYLVTIHAIRSDVDWLNTVQESSRQASGVIVAENGVELLIVADYSVLKDAEELQVTFYNNTVVTATVKSLDKDTNLAMLSVLLTNLPETMQENLPIAVLASTGYVPVGTPVVVLGSPMGSLESIGYGMINMNKTYLSRVDEEDAVLWTDIAGSSNATGAIFNLQGQVMGILTTSVESPVSEGQIRAYSISELKARIEKMANDEAVGYLGITGTDVSTEAQAEQGVPAGAYVQTTEMDSPAMLSGILPGDVIVNMDGTEITDYDDYVKALEEKAPGDTTVLKLMRLTGEEYTEVSFTMEVQEKN